MEGSSGQRSAGTFAALNPVLKVPVLIDGDLTLFESDLIIVICYVSTPGMRPTLRRRHWPAK